ncbi:sulfate ABC transporter ATP-binding protein [Trinickia caryophylli]|uniref:Sulfate transport system ATP-binding protein n=1 Tax=Trinickia caryophylli TaxID=28094 RepID=A0A1X7FWE0_TRICW|nr:sulfate ABC transporter ATP-binding protein [Trinickia caryophylli]PMS11783.1 sulfate ABC transporter ATP-binding protein [Trinickia caryophylli]TRX17463.1 sulfate ABC transporter ATP-binding protein [Trinickia caryophylli]WQE11793.1 sulfate ABC transporter ATP-binding protein [Trinickia caryophylli]SMF59846.1 sulfate transport system ATP-binding protein [Trinickia caryophylli]GLU34707.1 sulfate/thiosulfate import ATP-binding protein CysA [Trinickia caryophylli]
MGITVRNVQKRFGAFTALDGVSLQFERGELAALIGPSGCGKTTLLRVIAGLEAADAGEIVLNGRDVSGLDARERQVGFVFQHYALFRHMTVFENVAFGLRVKPRRMRPSDSAIRARVRELLALVQLGHLGERYPAELSGGQRQRVALARALAVEPSVLLLDEPFGALDAKVRKELRGWLRRLHDELAITTIFVTHDQEEALDVADRIVVLNRGRIEQQGAPDEVYERPLTPFVYDFLGAANRVPGTIAPHGFVVDGARAPLASDAVTGAGTAASGPTVAYVRPHELELHPGDAARADGVAADVRRVLARGASVRVELAADTGMLEAELAREAWRSLELAEGDRVTVVPRSMRVFEAS